MRSLHRPRAILSGLWFMGCSGLTAWAILSVAGAEPQNNLIGGAHREVVIACFSLGGALWGSFLGSRILERGSGWSRFGFGGVIIAVSSLPTGLAFFCVYGALALLGESSPGHWYEVPVAIAWTFAMSCIYSVAGMIAVWWFLPALLSGGFVAGMLFPVFVGIAQAVLDPDTSESGTT